MEFIEPPSERAHFAPTERQMRFLRLVLDNEIENLTDDQVLKIVNTMAFGTRGETTSLIGSIKRWEQRA